jgi:hypothetical protein
MTTIESYPHISPDGDQISVPMRINLSTPDEVRL